MNRMGRVPSPVEHRRVGKRPESMQHRDKHTGYGRAGTIGTTDVDYYLYTFTFLENVYGTK